MMDESLEDSLDAGVAELRSGGRDNEGIRKWLIDEIDTHNNAGNPNPHPVTVGQLNDYFERCTPRLRKVAGKEDEIVIESYY